MTMMIMMMMILQLSIAIENSKDGTTSTISMKNVSYPNSQGTTMKSVHKLMIKAKIVFKSVMLGLFERIFAHEGQSRLACSFRNELKDPSSTERGAVPFEVLFWSVHVFS